ncbi:MAG: rhomboid family intramembrane serine protease [Rhodobacterales bacterium]|nr:rhomboid family intramembrane serine protease [Rhodobacterales bacterium]
MVQIRTQGLEISLSWEEWEERVRAGRVPASAEVRFEPITGDKWMRAGDLEMYQSLLQKNTLAWKNQFTRSGPPLLTALLVGVQIRLWWAALWTPETRNWMLSDLTVYAPAVFEDGQVWRLITMGFSHTDSAHIGLNMLWLGYTGWNLERALGRANLLCLYLSAVMVGSLFSMFGSPETPSLGASGGVYGLVAASVVFGFARPQLLPERGRRMFGWALLPYLVLMFMSGLSNAQTDNWCHLGGLLTGALLAPFLDPPPLQRRPHWNRGLYTITGGASLLVLLVMGLAGPNVQPLTSPREARAAWRGAPLRNLPEDHYQPLDYVVPAGWKPGTNAAGDVSFESPAGPRSFSVIEKRHKSPQSIELRQEQWFIRLKRGWPEATLEHLPATQLGGEVAETMRVRLEAVDGVQIIEWRGVVRGQWTLESVWACAESDQVEVLHQRLLDRITWSEPDNLRRARIHFEHDPDSPKARNGWAKALAEFGQIAEALQIRQALVDEYPTQTEYRVALITLLDQYPTLIDVAPVWAEALETDGSGRIIASIADALEHAGRRWDGAGLLDLGWQIHPGDRAIRHNRRALGLSVALDGSQPWSLVNNPVSGLARTPEEHAQLLNVSLTLEAAIERGQILAQEREAVINRVVEGLEPGDSDRLMPPLLWLRNGEVPTDEKTIQKTKDQVLTAWSGGVAPAWRPEPALEAVKRFGIPWVVTPTKP